MPERTVDGNDHLIMDGDRRSLGLVAWSSSEPVSTRALSAGRVEPQDAPAAGGAVQRGPVRRHVVLEPG